MLILLIIHLRTPKTNSSYVYKIPHKSVSIDKVCTRLSLLPTATTQYVYDWRTNAHRMITALVTFALLKYISDWWSVSIRIQKSDHTDTVETLLPPKQLQSLSFRMWNICNYYPSVFGWKLIPGVSIRSHGQTASGLHQFLLSELSVLKIYKKYTS